MQTAPDALYRSIEQVFISGDLKQADAELRRAASSIQGEGPVWVATFRLQQAKVWIYQGHSREALPLLETELPSDQRSAELDVTRRTLLSIAYARTGNLAGAERATLDAERECRGESSLAGVRLAQGIVYLEGARLTDAERAFHRSYITAHNSGDRFVETQALLNLGVVALRQEHYDDALDRFSQASTVANAIGARQAAEKATASEGGALYKLGDFQRALANYQLAEKQAVGLGSTIDQVRLFNDSGLSQYRLGDLKAARSSYEHSLQLAHSIQNNEEIGDALVALASLSLQTGDLPGALQRSREAKQLAEQRGNSSDTLRPSLIEALALEGRGEIPAAKDRLLSLQQKSSTKPSIRWEVENALAKLFADAGDGPSADAWFRRAIETFHGQRSSVSNINSRLPFFENGSSLYLSYMEYLIGGGRVDDALAILDQGRAETLAEGLVATAGLPAAPANKAATNLNAVARRLDATILVYCLRPGTSYLWAIAPARTAFFRLPGREVILPLIESHTRAVLSAKDVLLQANAPGFALYRDLVQPAGTLISPGGRVFVIADQGMNGLNFETLLTSSEQPHFWIEDVNVINARSLSLLAKSQIASQPDEAPKRILLVGDPVYNRPEYERLAHASEEVTSVASHFTPEHRMVLTGAQATPAAYQLSRPGEFAYIHFVAHGTASEINPLNSAVILSAKADDAETYKLYARDILDKKLHADLVTISSCYGSGARSYSGEGLVGLAWAFLRAGSHNVVGALWEVSDVSTPLLMSDLYDGLSHGSNPSTSLRAAKLSMIRRGGIFRKPLYWAPFQLYAGV